MQWPRWSELLLALVALGAAVGIGFAAGGTRTASPTGHLTVTASGSDWIVPQIAQVNLGANENATTPQAALGKLSNVANAVLAAVSKQGIAAADVQTSNLNVGQYWGPNGRQSGYQASEQFTITVRKLGVIGPVISAATAAGANQVNGVSLQPVDPNAGQQQAVAAALKSARKEALAEAQELGVQLGKVTAVQIQPSGGPVPIYAAMAKAAQASPSLPIPTGSQQVTVSVQVTYGFR